MGAECAADIQDDCNKGSTALGIHLEYFRGLLVAVVYSWNNVIGHRNRGSLILGVCWRDLRQYGEVDEKCWLFELVLISLPLPFWQWAGVVFVFARYMRWLLAHPSLILHILSISSIIYFDHSQWRDDRGLFGAVG